MKRNDVALLALMLLAQVGTVQAAYAGRINPPTIAQKNLDRTVIPGQRVGAITAKTTKADLVKLFGASRLKDETTLFFGGDAEFPGTVIQLGQGRDLTVLWKNQKRTQISGVMINDPQWKTPEGIGVGTTLNQLRKQFGEFGLSGFGWDYGGIPRISKPASYRKLTFRLGTDENIYNKYPEETRAVSGDVQLSSKDPRLQMLGVKVRQMLFFFD